MSTPALPMLTLLDLKTVVVRDQMVAVYSGGGTPVQQSGRIHVRSGITLPVDQWRLVMHAALPLGRYNGFEVDRVANWLSTFPGIQVEAAREGSVACYVHGPARTLRRIQKNLSAIGADASDFETASETSRGSGPLWIWWD